MPWSMFLTLAVFFVPTYALISGMMIAVGSMVTETRQGQQIAGAMNMLFTLPFFFIIVFFIGAQQPAGDDPDDLSDDVVSHHRAALEHDDHSAVGDDRRLGSGDGSAVGMVWVAARVFRMGMLQYGQRLDVKTVLRAVRTGGKGILESSELWQG